MRPTTLYACFTAIALLLQQQDPNIQPEPGELRELTASEARLILHGDGQNQYAEPTFELNFDRDLTGILDSIAAAARTNKESLTFDLLVRGTNRDKLQSKVQYIVETKPKLYRAYVDMIEVELRSRGFTIDREPGKFSFTVSWKRR